MNQPVAQDIEYPSKKSSDLSRTNLKIPNNNLISDD